MKRLLATTAVIGLMAAAPAWAGSVNIVLQNFNVSDEQNVLNEIQAGAVDNAKQAGSNAANIADIADTSPGAGGGADPDDGTALDPLIAAAIESALSLPPGSVAAFLASHGDIYVFAQAFADVQRVVNTTTATAGTADVDQEGTNAVNVALVNDTFDGTDVGDGYLAFQTFGGPGANLFGDTEDTKQFVENTIQAAGDVEDSSQKGTNVANFVGITDLGNAIDPGELQGNQILVAQLAGGLDDTITKQYVGNKAVAGDDISSLVQEGTNVVNVVSVSSDDHQVSGLMLTVQNTAENFDQSAWNYAKAHSIADGVEQSGSNVANVVSVEIQVENDD